MLKYFVDTTEALLAVAVIAGIISGYARLAFGKIGKITMPIGLILGIVCSGIMSYMKNATKKIDASVWSLNIFQYTTILAVVFAVSAVLGIVLKKNKTADIVTSLTGSLSLAVIEVLLLLYSLPDILAYPYNILLVEKSVISTNFILKTIGIILALILLYVTGTALKNGMLRLNIYAGFGIAFAELAVNAYKQIFGILRIMYTKSAGEDYIKLFGFIKFKRERDLFLQIAKVQNNEKYFLYIAMAIGLIVPVIIWIKSFTAKETYSNPAEHRKIRFKWRVNRRWATVVILSLCMCMLNLTALKTMANKVVELSPVEEAVEDGTNVYVPFESVSDGHLHRFGYKAPSGTEIRFIVIKKPNSSSYGIGLDACDICGETGYYEKDGQVVCKLCDVVMNINTIGFKGGCNPIVIPYSIENGNIILPIEGLMEYENEFK